MTLEQFDFLKTLEDRDHLKESVQIADRIERKIPELPDNVINPEGLNLLATTLIPKMVPEEVRSNPDLVTQILREVSEILIDRKIINTPSRMVIRDTDPDEINRLLSGASSRRFEDEEADGMKSQ